MRLGVKTKGEGDVRSKEKGEAIFSNTKYMKKKEGKDVKTKKSISLILALVMVLALACGAWAATAVISADAGEDITRTQNVNAPTGNQSYGIWALNGGKINLTGNIETDGYQAYGAYAYSNDAYLNITGNVSTKDEGAHALLAQATGAIVAKGNVATNGKSAYGLVATNNAKITLTGDVSTNGEEAHSVYIHDNSRIEVEGDIRGEGYKVRGVDVQQGSSFKLLGDLTVVGEMSRGIWARHSSIVDMTGNLTVSGDSTYGIGVESGATVDISEGTITVLDDDANSAALYVGSDGVLNLTDTIVDSENLLRAVGPATVNAESSTLDGDILHDGTNVGTLDITLTDSVWDGGAEAIDDIGSIDITLVGSDWNITGDTNTNGKVTADADSNIDFRGATDNIVVEIDSLAGDPGLNIKLDDELIIKNPAGSFESSDPSVIQIVKNADDSVSIIPLKDGDVTLTYQYLDENNKIQTGKIGVVSGSGGGKTGGGGSSGCNAGFGVLALLGLAFVYKKK